MRSAAAISEPPGARVGQVEAAGRWRRHEPALDGLRVLVVEDEMLIAMDLESALEEAGADVVGLAATVDRALALIDRESMDAAVLDVNLRGRDVYPVADALKARGVPFLFHTGHATRESLQARYLGVPVLTKPTDLDRVLSALQHLVQGKA